uniref:Uncharacterized protein n=1 Tax=Ditylum brightwellii TaxID=49249 RepID=A0A6V2M3V7_9STRA
MVKTNLLGHHHLDKFFVVDLTISINIGLADHLINLLISELFPKVGHDVTQFGSRDEAISVLVENLEGLKNFLLTVCVLHLASHHCQKLGEVNGSISIRVDLRCAIGK